MFMYMYNLSNLKLLLGRISFLKEMRTVFTYLLTEAEEAAAEETETPKKKKKKKKQQQQEEEVEIKEEEEEAGPAQEVRSETA